MATKDIAALNDRFRETLTGGRIHITAGIQALGFVSMNGIMQQIRSFKVFTEDNDPYGEHDFGKVTFAGKSAFWKIDYYDKDMEFGSHDPSDPSQTTRVLTVMLPEEY